MFRLTIAFFFILVNLPLYASEQVKDDYLTLKLSNSSQEFKFSSSTRLHQALTALEKHNVYLTYPLSTTLFSLNPSDVEQARLSKERVLDLMKEYKLNKTELFNFIQRSGTSKRVISNIDLDTVRLNKKNNPLLKGKYILSVGERGIPLLVLGNTPKVATIPTEENMSLSSLLNDETSLFKNLEHAPVLIYPDGKLTQSHIGNWKTKSYSLPPGTIIYIPFYKFEKSPLDKAIVELLINMNTAL
ncbi:MULTISPECIES: capsule biosynthesis GfcC family protein [unclassified Vibrio]|uniref:capsule biosynthesis GfcC family protein n=1 Tax=unclassified Vibrio TaxID=2614977 RepID=UPI0029643299|nr:MULTISPECIES: capsule biosynthesis GfcC family protein [unclassified Vibrio]MDW2276056.1 capsule biosynthesis GfcC family protein [Vibrio sp. 1074]MDW2287178.1 capsule biosynthesis GfcC family protein [Vibrio sp. 1562]MDW3123412.1 capsule biosynthesis GfcC family protein [Vibrio sp. 1974]